MSNVSLDLEIKSDAAIDALLKQFGPLELVTHIATGVRRQTNGSVHKYTRDTGQCEAEILEEWAANDGLEKFQDAHACCREGIDHVTGAPLERVAA